MIKNNPLVSIIINCYNGERFLKEAIDSIYMQNYNNWEIIFWDNASDDNSAEIANSYDERLKYFCATKTSDLGMARNLAIQEATGKYIAFLDCDDRYLTHKITSQVDRLCYASVIVINENGFEINRNIVTDKSGFILGQLLSRYEINMQTVMIRRSVLLENNLSFDESLKFSPDYDLFMRIVAKHSSCSISSCLVDYRKVKDSLTSKMINYIAPEMEYTLKNLYSNLDLREELQRDFNKAFIMLNFYRSLPFVQAGDYTNARKFIWKSIFIRKRYLLYYFATLLPINSSWLLKKMMK